MIFANVILPLLVGTGVGVHLWRLAKKVSKKEMSNKQRKGSQLGALSAALLMIKTIYPIMASSAVQVFAPCHELCTEVNITGGNLCTQYSRADYAVDCDTTSHRIYAKAAAGFFGLFSVICPLALMARLCMNRKDLMKMTRLKSRETSLNPMGMGRHLLIRKPRSWEEQLVCSFFLKPWNMEYCLKEANGAQQFSDPLLHNPISIVYLWGVFDLGRKLLITSIIQLIVPGTAGQIFIALMFAIIPIFAELAWQPYRNPGENRLSLFALSNIAINIVLGAYLYTSRGDFNLKSKKRWCDLALLVLDAAFYVAFLALMTAPRDSKSAESRAALPSENEGHNVSEASHPICDNNDNTAIGAFFHSNNNQEVRNTTDTAQAQAKAASGNEERNVSVLLNAVCDNDTMGDFGERHFYPDLAPTSSQPYVFSHVGTCNSTSSPDEQD
jgi:hypothetical protein